MATKTNYDFWTGIKKSIFSSKVLIPIVTTIGAIVINLVPQDWANMTIGAASGLVINLIVNWIKIRFP